MSVRDWFVAKWRHSDPNIRREAIAMLSDPQALATVWKHDTDDSLRELALEQLINHVALANVGQRESTPCTACNGTGRQRSGGGGYQSCRSCRGSLVISYPKPVKIVLDLTGLRSTFNATHPLDVDLRWLLGLIAKRRSKDLGLWAVKAATEQDWLAKAAVTAVEGVVRKAAVEKLSDQAALALVARGDADPDVRKAAVEKLEDRAVLADIAVSDKAGHVRLAAAQKQRQ